MSYSNTFADEEVARDNYEHDRDCDPYDDYETVKTGGQR